MQSVKFKASLHAIRMDKEGESKLTLTIPVSDLPAAMLMSSAIEQLLEVSVSPVAE